MHAQRCGIHKHTDFRQQRRNFRPSYRRYGAPELLAQRVRAFDRAVGDMDVFEAALDQTKYHRTRRPACSQHQRRFSLIPARRSRIEIGEKTFDISVGGFQHAAIEPECVGGTYRKRAIVRHR